MMPEMESALDTPRIKYYFISVELFFENWYLMSWFLPFLYMLISSAWSGHWKDIHLLYGTQLCNKNIYHESSYLKAVSITPPVKLQADQ